MLTRMYGVGTGIPRRLVLDNFLEGRNLDRGLKFRAFGIQKDMAVEGLVELHRIIRRLESNIGAGKGGGFVAGPANNTRIFSPIVQHKNRDRAYRVFPG